MKNKKTIFTLLACLSISSVCLFINSLKLGQVSLKLNQVLRSSMLSHLSPIRCAISATYKRRKRCRSSTF